MVISIDSAKGFDKIQQPQMIKNLKKLRIRELLNLVKGTYKTLPPTSYLTVKDSAFPLRLGKMQEFLL